MPVLTTSPFVKTYTLEEFWELPEPTDRSKLELIAGVLYMSPPPDPVHDTMISRLVRILSRRLDEIDDDGQLYLPRAALWAGPETYLEPDLFYVSSELAARLDPKRRSSADLVVEVLSPGSTEQYDRTTKADTYGAMEARELWLIDRRTKRIEVRANRGGGFGPGEVFARNEPVVSAVFPNLVLTAGQLLR